MKKDLVTRIPAIVDLAINQPLTHEQNSYATGMGVGNVTPNIIMARMALTAASSVLESEMGAPFKQRLFQRSKAAALQRQPIVASAGEDLTAIFGTYTFKPPFLVVASDLKVTGRGDTAFIRRDGVSGALYALEAPRTYRDFFRCFFNFLASDRPDLQRLEELSFGAAARSKVAYIESLFDIRNNRARIAQIITH